jgi:hypothetical protein
VLYVPEGSDVPDWLYPRSGIQETDRFLLCMSIDSATRLECRRLLLLDSISLTYDWAGTNVVGLFRKLGGRSRSILLSSVVSSVFSSSVVWRLVVE